ncbi:NAD-dependent epimerase/dehydratase family protein [Anaerolineales bacterium HSG24]|nr:NAD-dependent epimerase/dehydratase family protein [Anaerolineales bacterium HSG24]
MPSIIRRFAIIRTMKALVTGGAGFIGSHVAKQLIKNSYDVMILDDLSGGNLENLSPKTQFINGSITNYELIKEIFRTEKFDYVYHLAAYAAEGLSHFIRRFNYTNNLIGSVNLINESIRHEVKCFIFTSSIAVYGANTPPMAESMSPLPEDPYGVAKYAVEMDLEAAHKQFGLDYIIFRPHNVYGENQNIGDKYRNVIGIFMNQILQGQPLTIFGDGKQSRAFTYIDDVAPIIAQSVENRAAYNNAFNIGGDTPYSLNELAKAVCQAMEAETELTYLAARNEVTHAYCDHSKLRAFFNTQPKTSLEVGLARMAQWVREVGAQKTELFTEIEINEGLPAGW